MIRKLILLLTLTAGTITGFSQQSYDDQVADYIAKYKSMAIEEQKRSGVPASITLAQGILETSAGQSELCNNASNHFGIKCKNTWTGETYSYTDDAKDECFRKYDCAKTSYADHSDFLKSNKRYSNLFSLSPTDYAAWAYGLKRCGYATNPQYAQKLIKFIEDYKLQQYTYAALDNSGEEILYAAAQPKAIYKTTNVSNVTPGENIPRNDANYTSSGTLNEQPEIYVEKARQQQEETNSVAKDYYTITTKNGLKGFYARKGDILLEFAIKNKVRYAKLLEFNDLPDAPLEADMFIYLSKKPKTSNTFTHTVVAGETMLQISQDEGIQLGELLALNHLSKGQEAVPGSVLNLQSPSDKVPEIYVNAPANNNNAPTQRVVQLSNDAGFVPAGKPVEINDSDNETVTDLSQGRTEAPVNIANEQPVEETIVETRPAKQQPQITPKNQTALDKLKAHMDKVVYNQTEFEPKSSGNYDRNDSDEETVTPSTTKNETVKTTAKQNKTKITPKAAAKPKVHTVKKGETLFAIADKYGMTVKELQKLNKLKSNNIQPGTKLKVVK
ncbi:LysM peptidoglycan-binding domain-containing protein [Taibaiella lutea]|uniref:Peptidoglycan hydrolase n=1 Tax=Taibaiella lutea TaxID=2608001 RepID=A0A5M6CT63_9BACT|nr:glucosaminidase domain-containing protein [Taibaiella lutea]KAA5537152.1 LysM peptidoglycan-binding domain-containing protein [Taibaiella lutea]